mgnify:CR=1 FL=1
MEFNGEALQCQMIEDGVVEMTFDLQNESVNKFNRVTMEEYREVVSLLGKERNLKGLLINSAKEAFIVGADITEFLGFFQIPQDTKDTARQKREAIKAKGSKLLSCISILKF